MEASPDNTSNQKREVAAVKELSDLVVGDKSFAEIVTELKEKSISVSKFAKGMAERFEDTTFEKETITFVVLVQGELLGEAGKSIDPRVFLEEDFLAAHGLRLCKPEDAWFVRAIYTDQPTGERIQVGMSPVRDKDQKMRVYTIGNYPEGLELASLNLEFGHPSDTSNTHLRTNPQTLWLFRKS